MRRSVTIGAWPAPTISVIPPMDETRAARCGGRSHPVDYVGISPNYPTLPSVSSFLTKSAGVRARTRKGYVHAYQVSASSHRVGELAGPVALCRVGLWRFDRTGR